jgi:hypothetical protein
MDESSCIYKEVSSWVWLKIWDFSTNTEKKMGKPCFYPTSYASRAWGHHFEFWKHGFYHVFCTLGACGSTSEAHCFSFLCSFAIFFVLLSAFFLQIGLGTWERIPSTCNVFIGLLNLHSMHSQFFMRRHCFAELHDFFRILTKHLRIVRFKE